MYKLSPFIGRRKHSRDVKRYRKLFDKFAMDTGIQTQLEWYSTKLVSCASELATIFQLEFKESRYKALKTVYPEYLWYPWLFTASPANYFKTVQHCRNYFDWLAEELNIETQADWYNVPQSTILSIKASHVVLKKWNGSTSRALRDVYPEFEWNHWMFEKCHQGYWRTSTDTHRHYFEWVAEQLGISKEEDWYAVSVDQIASLRGGSLLCDYYGHSLQNALQVLFPQTEWLPWKWSRTSAGYWDSKANQRRAMDWLAQKLGIEEKHHWYKVTKSMLKEHKLSSFVMQYYGSLRKALSHIYPEEAWSHFFDLSEGQRNVQLLLKELVKEEVMVNYKHPQLLHPNSKKKMELDIYIPAYELALEYQGGHHYSKRSTSMSEYNEQADRDFHKAQACKQCGISLIQIPYWWNCTPNSLASTLKKVRPDIVLHGISVRSDYIGESIS